MTEVAEPPPATERACLRCGAPLGEDQDWCLNCGTAVGTRVAPTPRWRGPVALVGSLLAALALALALALVELSGDPQPVATTQPTPAPAATAIPTPAPTAVAGTTPTPTPLPGATPSPTPSPANGATPLPSATPSTTGSAIAQWPAGRTAYTVVIASNPSRAQAEQRARKEASQGGGEVGVLHSDDYSSLRKGYWVVFSGQYPSRQQAADAAQSRGSEAYARRVVPR